MQNSSLLNMDWLVTSLLLCLINQPSFSLSAFSHFSGDTIFRQIFLRLFIHCLPRALSLLLISLVSTALSTPLTLANINCFRDYPFFIFTGIAQRYSQSTMLRTSKLLSILFSKLYDSHLFFKTTSSPIVISEMSKAYNDIKMNIPFPKAASFLIPLLFLEGAGETSGA